MILSKRFEIRQGPMGNDYALIEKHEYFSEKYNEMRTKETPRYYPTMESLAKGVARLEGVEAIVLESIEQVKASLAAVEAAVRESSRVA